MTRTLVWKELREQWLVWLCVTLATAGGTAGLCVLLSNTGPNRDGLVAGVLWFAAWGYGLLCGALLLAGETEEGTQTFLDCLPATRRRLWGIKAATGLSLLAAQLIALSGIAYLAVTRTYPVNQAAIAFCGLLICGAMGYAWGLFSGSFSRTVIAAIGWAALLFVLSTLCLLPVVLLSLLALPTPVSDTVFDATWLVAMFAVAFVAAERSRTAYCRIDRQRVRKEAQPKRALQPGWGVLLVLAWMQVRWFAFAMMIYSVFGIAAVAFLRLAAWPVVTLLAGVLCGVTTFADEQQSGANRFLGDQRFPLGRIWLVKTGIRVATAIATAVLIALGVAALVAIRAATSPGADALAFRRGLESSVLAGVLTQPLYFLTLGVVYGYAVGNLCGMLFRKPLVACLVAAAVALPLASLWAPSLFIGGGLHLWQVWATPVVLIAAARLLMRPWSADWLFSWRAFAIAGGAASLAILWLAAALWYRAEEIPEAPDAIDLEAFKASLPAPEENIGGRLTAAGLRRLDDIERNFDRLESARRQDILPRPGPQRSKARAFAFYASQAEDVVARGWQDADNDFRLFLDEMFRDKWIRDLAEAADQPAGIALDPRNANNSLELAVFNAPYRASRLLVARGLERQAMGEPEAYLEYLRIGLSISRNMRHRTAAIAVLVGVATESRMVGPTERWLEQLEGRPDLLRRALAMLQAQASEPPTDVEEIRKAELLILFNALADPTNLPITVNQFDPFAVGTLESIDLQRFSLQVPWEKTRQRRMLQALASHDEDLADRAFKLGPFALRLTTQPFFRNRFFHKKYPGPEALCILRAAILQVALRLYQAEKGKSAESLAELVPEYLPSVPVDPYDDRPFRYRLSRGEKLDWPPSDLATGEAQSARPGEPAADDGRSSGDGRFVPAGQGILWSVGKDGVDHGGRAQESPHSPGKVSGTDAIFLVPLPPSLRINRRPAADVERARRD